MRGVAPRPSSSELTIEEVAMAEEAMAGTRDALDAFAAELWWCVRSLGVFKSEVRLLGMSAGSGEEATSSWSSRQSGILKVCLKSWGCCWWCCEGVWVVELCSGVSSQGGAVEVSAGMGSWFFLAMVGLVWNELSPRTLGSPLPTSSSKRQRRVSERL